MTRAQLPAQPRLALLLRLLHEQYTQDVDAALRQAGFGDIRPGQAKVFPFVPPEGIPVGELADRAGVRKQTMAEAVDQLERVGYVERRPNPRDARSQLISLTRRGQLVRPVAAAAGDHVEKSWAELTSPAQIEELRQNLRHLLDQIAERDAGGSGSGSGSGSGR
jgi:DNA-binding MarR family transcriptional regulator